MASSKLSGSGPKEEGLTYTDRRISCSFCLNPLRPGRSKRCGRCHRRPYCGRACQETDWRETNHAWLTESCPCSVERRDGVGHGHKNWCGLPYGEEGLDWVVKEKKGRGRVKKLGLFALRDLPRFYRIRVEGLKMPCDCCPRRSKAPGSPPTVWSGEGGVEYEGFRELELDHACDGNAGLVMDETVRVSILYATRPIAKGEEIKVPLKLHNDIFHPILSQNEFADLLRKEYGVVCPDGCSCKDGTVRVKLEELGAEVALLLKEKDKTLTLEQAIRLMQLGKEVIPLHLMPKLHGILSKMVVLGTGEEGEVLELLRPYMTEVKEFVEAVFHPKNRFVGFELAPEDPMELKVADISSSSSSSRGCCRPIDVDKWAAIIKRCNSKSVILLPEGAFSFPPKYDLRSLIPGLTISGKGPDKTTLCIQHGGKSSGPSHPNALHLCSSMTLENLTVKCSDTVKYGWPGLTLLEKKTNCVIRNVKFFNCSLFSGSKSTVEDCEFSSNLLDVSVMPEPDDIELLTGTGMQFFGDECCGGSIIKNVTFRNLLCGIRKICAVDSDSDEATNQATKPHWIENVKCWNVNTGVQLINSTGDTVKDVIYEWWVSDDQTGLLENPATAVAIIGGDENTVDGIVCNGNRTDFYAFTVTPNTTHGPRGNKIRNVKGAKGRYVDEGVDTEISNVED